MTFSRQNIMDFGSIPIGFVRFSIRMGWKWVGIDGKGCANTTFISEFHTPRQTGVFEKKGCRAVAAAGFWRRPATLVFENSGLPGCGDGIRTCRLRSHTLCHQVQLISSFEITHLFAVKYIIAKCW